MLKRFFLGIAAVIWILAILNPLSYDHAQVSAASPLVANGRFRVVVAATLATTVDVWVDGAATAEVAVKPLNSSGFITVTATANHIVSLFQTGTTTAVGPTYTINLTSANDTSLIFLSGNTWMSLLDSGVAPNPSEATARVINLSPDNLSVSLVVDATTPSPFTFPAVDYKSASPAYAAFSVGPHTLSIPADSTIPSITYNFKNGHVYSIFLFRDTNLAKTKILVAAEKSFSTGPTKLFFPIVFH